MSNPKLAKGEIEICRRFRDARENVAKVTSSECARLLGIERSTLANYEFARTALRFDIALRFCRQFIISEEWLATGRYDLFHEQVAREGIIAHLPAQNWQEFDRIISIRQSMDLLSDPSFIHIKPGALFSSAWTQILENRYRELLAGWWFIPRLNLSDDDRPEVGFNYLQAINERHVALLVNDAASLKTKPVTLRRAYIWYSIVCGITAFRILRGTPIDLNLASELMWLVNALPKETFGGVPLASGPSAYIPSMPGPMSGKIGGNDLTETETHGKVEGVKSQLPTLLERLKKASEPAGQKTALAKFLGVPLASVSRWLSGEREPGGEITLQLLKWVEQQERQK